MNKQSRVLVVGDIHEPFAHPDYFQFILDVQKQYKTTETLFIGDVADFHAVSRHEHDADGWSAGDELDRTIDKLKKWHKAFPRAKVVFGNHDVRVMKRLFSSGVPQRWLKAFNDVMGVPTWDFQLRHKIDDVLYIHGEGVTARSKAQRAGTSVVQGHRHNESYAHFIPTERGMLFGMQVGCGVDEQAYAMAYAKDGAPQALSCGVVIGGQLPIVIPMI